MTEFHGVIVALEFLTMIAIVGIGCALALVIAALADQIGKKEEDDEHR